MWDIFVLFAVCFAGLDRTPEVARELPVCLLVGVLIVKDIIHIQGTFYKRSRGSPQWTVLRGTFDMGVTANFDVVRMCTINGARPPLMEVKMVLWSFLSVNI